MARGNFTLKSDSLDRFEQVERSKMQFQPNFFPCKKCVTEKRTKLKKNHFINSMSSLLTIFLSIPFNNLPCFSLYSNFKISAATQICHH